MTPYNLFLFDLDDTLLDFKASERLSLLRTLESLGIRTNQQDILERYQVENNALWKLFELGQTTKEHLKVERFRRTFKAVQIEIDPELASARYLEALPETVVLTEYAEEICHWLSLSAEIGIVTNGIHTVQNQRIRRSKLAPYISFISVSEECGFAKPDVRFFEYSVKKAKAFAKASSLVIGDRLETDILGAHNFGLDGLWFNPGKLSHNGDYSPKYQVGHLSEIQTILSQSGKK